MATETKVITIPAKAATISQVDLAHFLEMKQYAERLAEDVKTAEAFFREKLEAGAEVEPGIFRAFLKTSERRNPQWKEVTMRLADRLHELDAKHPAGEGYCALVLAGTKPTEYTRLIVEA